MILEQEKLDVSNKKRSNLFNWRGQFTPEFVEYILENFTKKGDHILDPFSGSGTVLQEAARFDLTATGLEINPSAYAMSRFFSFCNLPLADRFDFINSFEIKLNSALCNLNGQKVYKDDPDYRIAYSELLAFSNRFRPTLTDKQQVVFFLNILFKSERDKNLALKDSLYKSFSYAKDCLLGLPYTTKQINAKLMDARNAGDVLENEIDFIITSPPYINVFNYHQNYRAIIEEFKYDILKVASSEFGSNRKNRGNRLKTVIQYCIDMELAIRSFWKALKPNGQMVMIVGRESNVRGIPFYNGQLIIEILESCGGFSKVKVLERQFINKFGVNIKEDIIVVSKSKCLQLEANIGRNIATLHLESNLNTVEKDVYSDLMDAIANSKFVDASPLFNANKIIKND